MLNYFGIFLFGSVLILFISLKSNRLSATTISHVLINSSSSNSKLLFADEKHNIVMAGDWTCNSETQKAIDNVINSNPHLIISTGDHVLNVTSADCWTSMSAKIKDKMKITIGNHDIESEIIYKEILDYHNITNPYYSYDFQNIHFISLSTEHPYGPQSIQYEFIKKIWRKHLRI